MVNACLDDDRLDRYTRQLCSDDESAQIEAHLSSCDACRARAGGGDDALLDHVRRVMADIEVASPLPSAGAVIGGFRIIERVGAGGMGVVYRAEQRQPRRVVALKLLRAMAAGDEQHRRFAQEAELLGRLQHPGIAQIHAAGVDDAVDGPRPWIALEFVRGAPLSQWSKDVMPDVRTRIELLARVCDAVQHAHHRGIVHRDLKPSNILVDEAGQPRILDFGVAKLVDTDAGTTRDGQLVGTVAYMSPEQVAGDSTAVDTRSDVYALGVIAYELLAGARPHDLSGATLADAVRAVCEVDPQPLGRLDRRLRGDVEVVVAKALEKHPARRYQTVAAFGDDLRRCLNDEPVTARAAGVMYHMSKLARRHRVLVAAVAVALIALVSATILSLAFAASALRAAEAEAREREQTEEVVAFLQLMLASGDPHEGGRGSVVDALDQATVLLEDAGLDPRVRAHVHAAVGETNMHLRRFEEAAPHLVAAAEAFDRFGTDQDAAASHNNAAIALRHLGRLDEAETHYLAALEGHRALGDDDAEAMVALNLARLLLGRDRATDAVPHVENAKRIWTTLHAPGHLNRIAATTVSAEIAANLDRPRDAVAALQIALDEIDRAAEPNPMELKVVLELAQLHDELDEDDEAEQLLRRAYALTATRRPNASDRFATVDRFTRWLMEHDHVEEACDVVATYVRTCIDTFGPEDPATTRARELELLLID